MNRDSKGWWLALAVVIVGFMNTIPESPTQWSYQDWLQLVTVVLAWATGKLATSPLKGAAKGAS